MRRSQLVNHCTNPPEVVVVRTAALFAVVSLGFLASEPAAAANTADSSIYDLAQVSLSQEHPGKAVYTVHWTGDAFGQAELHTGSGSALDFGVSAACPEPLQLDDSTVILEASISKLRLHLGSETGAQWYFEPGDGHTKFAAKQGSLPIIGASGPIDKHSWEGNVLPVGAYQIGYVVPAEIAITACNERLAELEAQGFSRAAALSRIGELEPFEVQAKAELGCAAKMLEEIDGEWLESDKAYLAETSELPLGMKASCESPIGPPEPASDELTQSFGVTNVALAPVEAVQQTSCPATVRYQGSITSNGPGEALYRYVTEEGPQGPVYSVSFPSALRVPVSFEFEVEKPKVAAGGPLALPPATPGPPPTAPGDFVAKEIPTPSGMELEVDTAPGELSGWVRLDVIGGPQTNESFWKVICVSQLQGPGNLMARPPTSHRPLARNLPIANPRIPGRPDPGKLAVRSPAPSPTARGASGPDSKQNAKHTAQSGSSGKKNTQLRSQSGRPSPAAKAQRGKRAQSQASAPSKATIAPAPQKPDLVLKSVARAGGNRCRLVVANVGGKRSAATTLRLSAHGRRPTAVALGPILPGQKRAVEAKVAAGVAWRVKLDPKNAVREADEGNNEASVQDCQSLPRR